MADAGYYVYILYLDAELTRPFYVGMGSGKRLQYHHGERWHNGERGEILRELKRTLGFIPSQKIQDGLTKAGAYAIERALIAQFGRTPDGPLVNQNDGGQGSNRPIGIPCSPETRAKISASLKGRKQPRDVVARRAASNSIAQRGKKRGPQSPEWIASRAAGLKLAHAEGRHPGSGMAGKKHKPETLAKMSVTAKRNGYKPPGSRQKGQSYGPHPAQIKEKMSASQLLRWSKIPPDKRRKKPPSAETRRKLSEASKRQWERRRGDA